MTKWLIDDWRQAWRFLSVQLSALGAAASAAWIMLTDAQREALLSFLPGGNGAAYVVLVTFVAIIAGRLKQQRIDAPPEQGQGDAER